MSKNKAPKYSKKQFLSAKKFTEYRYVLDVLLKDDTLYTTEEVKNLVEKFMKGRVI